MKTAKAVCKFFAQLSAFVWASPYTFLGATIGIVGLCTGGKVRLRGKTVEFFGGGTKWLITHLPAGQYTLGMTLGHTILGQTGASLDICRDHELVHVAQYERWGPLFVPAYLLCSLWMWVAGKNPYRDNPFEREAFDRVK